VRRNLLQVKELRLDLAGDAIASNSIP